MMIEFIKSLNLENLVAAPTRKNNFLDLLFKTNECKIENSIVSEPFLNSDHSSILWTLNISNVENPCIDKKPFIDWKNGNYTAINRYLANYPWTKLLDPFADINTNYMRFLQVVGEVIHANIPIKPYKARNKPTLPHHIQKTIDYRTKLLKNINYHFKLISLHVE
jgi:hypothetical protein